MKRTAILIAFLLLFFTQALYSQRPDVDFLATFSTNGPGNIYRGGAAIDHLGNTYLAGYFDQDVDFDPGPGVLLKQVSSDNSATGFLLKLDTAGALLWVKAFNTNYAGSGTVQKKVTVLKVAVDLNNNVYVVGGFEYGIDLLDTGSTITNTLNAPPTSNQSGFLAKFDSNGAYQWSHPFTSTQVASASDVELDLNGNVYVSVNFEGTLTYWGSMGWVSKQSVGVDAMVIKYNGSGGFEEVMILSGPGDDRVFEMYKPYSKDLYLAGIFQDTIHPNSGVNGLVSLGGDDVFMGRFDSSLSPVWFKQIGGSKKFDYIYGLEVDESRNRFFISGMYNDSTDFDPSSSVHRIPAIGRQYFDAYVAAYDLNGSFLWVSNMSGGIRAAAWELAIDKVSGDVLFTGGVITENRPFPLGTGYCFFNNFQDSVQGHGGEDLYLQRLSGTGTVLETSFYGSPSWENGRDILFYPSGEQLLVGYFGAGFTLDPYNPATNLGNHNSGTYDYKVFLMKYKMANPYYDTLTVLGCDTAYYENDIFLSNTSFNDTVYRNGGIDSMLHVQITLGAIESNIGYANGYLYGLDTTYHYQWYSCDSAKIVAGETNQFFLPSHNGSFALIATDGNCVDTSSCILVADVGLGERNKLEREIFIFPNPTSDVLHIQAKKGVHIEQVDVLNLSGQLLISTREVGQIDLEYLTPSIYLIRVKTAQGWFTTKVIKR